MRVFITGIGGEIGTRAARRIETDPRVTEISGVDLEPPRRMFRRTIFHYVDPTDLDAMTEAIAEIKPDVVVHLGIYEPHGRSTPQESEKRTITGTEVLLEALRRDGDVRHMVVRSGTEIYGHGPGSVDEPDETQACAPSSLFGRLLAHVEALVTDACAEFDATSLKLRCAPITGAHMPSPFARYLRMPLVPAPLPPAKHFQLTHVDDAARAFAVGALELIDDTINIGGRGSLTIYQALRIGRRIPLPVFGPALRFTGMITELAGSPLPGHTIELLTKGRLATTRRGQEVLGFEPAHNTDSVVHEIYDWSAESYLGELSKTKVASP